MPALVLCEGRRCERRWLVGSDDFVVSSVIGIAVRLLSLGGTLVILTYFFHLPSECLDENFQPEKIPSLLYGSLFAFSFILALTIFNEGIILSISLKGTIIDPYKKRENMKFWVLVHFVLTIIELLLSILCTGVVYNPSPHGGDGLQCPEYRNRPLLLAKVIVVLMLVTELVYIVGFFIVGDPSGLCRSPGILPNVEEVEEYVKNAPAELKRRNSDISTAVGQLHSNRITLGLKKLLGLLCCLGTKKSHTRTTALNELSLALLTLFSDEDVVPTDLVAGLVLVSRKQRKVMENCRREHGEETFRCPCSVSELRTVIFEHMPSDQKPNGFSTTNLTPPVPFDPSLVKEQLLLEDLIYYMKYSMGIYGWMLHVFDNLLCGPCQLLSATCCRCRCRHWNPMAKQDPELGSPRVVQDDCCMSGLATMELRCDLDDQHIIYITYENKIFQAPFSVCVDDKMRAVVLTVRGTLSIKDALTDISCSMVEVDEKYRNPDIEGKQYMHKGMYKTAKFIYNTLASKRLLEQAFSKNSDYRLVLTGHSLGAGVAGLLSVMLKPYYPDLHCYAFSPPGCMFSFSVACYTEDFMDAVVLNNDIIPRSSYLSYLYLKRQMKSLIRACEYSKFQVIFRPRAFDSLPFWVRNCLFSDKKDPVINYDEINEEIKKRFTSEGEKLGALNTFDNSVTRSLKTLRHGKNWRPYQLLETSPHSFIAGVEERILIASFPPRKVLHILEKYSRIPWMLQYCIPGSLSANHVNSEDLCEIMVDRGMVDDHLPNHVLDALYRCQKELVGSQSSSSEVRDLRMEERRKISELIELRKPFPETVVSESSLSYSLSDRTENSNVVEDHPESGMLVEVELHQ